MITVTHSSIDCFRTCHAKYFFEYDQCIKPKKKSWALIDGEAIHKGIEVYYLAKDIAKGAQGIDSIYTKYQNEEGIESHINLIKSLYEGYTLLYPLTEFEEYIPEIKGIVTVSNPYSNEPFNLAYKTDARIKKGGIFYLYENKTTSVWSLEKYLEELKLDDQADTYLYGERENGYSATGVIYNVMRKPKLKQGKMESEEGFMKRIRKAILEDVERAPDDRKYFWRETIYRNPDELRNFIEEMRRVVSDMEKYMIYKNPKRCGDYGGCKYLPICMGIAPEEKDELFKKKDAQHEELQEEKCTPSDSL